MSLLFNLFYSVLFVFFLLETFIYQGIIEKYFHINVYYLLFFYILFILIYSLFKTPQFHKLIKKLNNFILPISLIFYIIFKLIEINTYDNFVFTHTHIYFQVLLFLFFFCFTNLYVIQTPKDLFKKSIYLLSPILFLLFILIEKYQSQLFINIVQEDGVAEYLQFLAYAISGILIYKCAIKSKKIFKIIFITLSISLFFVAGEEISWGQRLMGIETPESIKEINYQDELTIHNINFIQSKLLHPAYILVGFLGTFSFLFFKYLAPNSKLIIFAPEKFLYFGFVFILIYYLIYDYYIVLNNIVYGNVPLVRWQEVAETFLSISFFGHALNIYQKISQSKSKSKIRQKI